MHLWVCHVRHNANSNVIPHHFFALGLVLCLSSLPCLQELNEPFRSGSCRIQQLPQLPTESACCYTFEVGRQPAQCLGPMTVWSMHNDVPWFATQHKVSDAAVTSCVSHQHEDLCRALLCRSHRGKQRAWYATEEGTHLTAPETPFFWITTEQIRFTGALDIHELRQCVRARSAALGPSTVCLEPRSSITIRGSSQVFIAQLLIHFHLRRSWPVRSKHGPRHHVKASVSQNKCDVMAPNSRCRTPSDTRFDNPPQKESQLHPSMSQVSHVLPHVSYHVVSLSVLPHFSSDVALPTQFIRKNVKYDYVGKFRSMKESTDPSSQVRQNCTSTHQIHSWSDSSKDARLGQCVEDVKENMHDDRKRARQDD